MFWKRKYKRNLDEIGQRQFNFDFQLEKIVCQYLCCEPLEKEILCDLDEKYKFNSYHQWKDYICKRSL